ncbi:MAG: DNA gyrase C-terminal beta-propeller domain-containing protein, partial [Planctomycetaceae bacterium]
TIRRSASRAEAKTNLQAIEVSSEMLARALGEYGFSIYQEEQGIAPVYRLSANQAEAIVSMQLGSLANLERDNLVGEHRQLLDDITGYRELLSDELRILALIRDDMQELKKKYSNPRRSEITGEELSDVDMETLIAEEPMVVTLSQRGYIKRIQLGAYQAQNRGGKGIMGAKADEEDPLEHVFVSSTHDYLLFFSDRGKVYWQKVYDLPLQSRTSKGRAIVNLLSLQEGERIYNCMPVRVFDEHRFLMMCTRNGVVKKTPLSAYSRPLKGGIIAINLDEDDELIEVAIVSKDDDVLLVTASGMSIRFSQADARSMGRNTRGVRGIKLSKGDRVIGMVVAHEDMSLLTVCENGFGKRTLFGSIEAALEEGVEGVAAEEPPIESDTDELEAEVQSDAAPEDELEEDVVDEGGEESPRGNMYYRRQRRGGKGIRDIRTSARNGKVVDCVGVHEEDDILMVTAAGKIQRIRAKEVSLVGRNTQGVRVIRLDDEDTLVSIARIPAEIVEPEDE